MGALAAARIVVDIRGNIPVSKHPGNPQQESHAQRDRYADRQDHEWDAEHDAHRPKQVADRHEPRAGVSRER